MVQRNLKGKIAEGLQGGTTFFSLTHMLEGLHQAPAGPENEAIPGDDVISELRQPAPKRYRRLVLDSG
jgi:hypothetical protein